ncbi:MAG TPA: PD-(D/E)XK nuclease family protein [Thermodesulfobacteriota bacterium]|jgi:CRISPR/Cas system-associated exonuclease Cas4 (RecB family)|nr:PD-(D/E)XK nuclease family protein [Thermodesulfobacteriota bacterium]
MNVLLISPTENLVEEVAEQLIGTDKDYSSNLVIFPGKRPSHFLRKVLADKEKSSFIPPITLSVDEFIEHVHDESLGLGGRKLEAIDAISILYSIHAASPEHLGKKSFLTPDTFFPVGMKLYNDLEELYIERIPPKKVREIDLVAGENIPEPMAKRLQSLSYFYEMLYKRIEEGHFSTRSSRYRAVSENIDRLNLGRLKKVILAGFFALTESEKKIFRSLMERENTLFIFQEGEGMTRKLSDLEITAVRKFDATGPEIHCYKSPDSHGQVLGVSRLLKDRGDKKGGFDENTVIVLPSPENLLPLFHQALSLLDPDNYNVSLGYPLQRTPLFGFFNNLMQVITSMDGDRLYVPYYLEFILHPYTKNIYFQGRAEITRILFHAIEETLTEKRTKKFLSLSELENDEAIIGSIKEKVLRVEPGIHLKMMREHLEAIHTHTIRKMLSFKDVGEFARKLKEVVEYIYQKSTARLHPFFYPYSESFIAQLDILSKSLMKEIRFQELGSYFTLFKKYIMTSYTPFAGTPLRGVQVLGFLETRNLKFENVLFLDANEGVIPDTTREDSLLPFKARQMLGLPTYLDREEIMSYYFNTLIHGAKEAHLFYIENDEKEKSRFVERLIWERQKKEGRRDAKGFVKTIQYAVNLRDESPRPINKSLEMIKFLKEYSFSATSLNTYLHCPLLFYYEYVLGLEEREVVSEEFEKEEIGSFVHLVLADYFRGRTGSVLSEKQLNLKEFEKIFYKHFEEQYGKDPTGEVYLLRNQVKNHLEDFIKNYQLPKIKEFQTRILSLEQRIDVVKDSFKLGARLDRVEKRTGRTVIIDYKTSANKNYLTINYNKLDLENRDSWNEAIGSLQLPFYLLTYSALTGEKPENIDCMFLLLGRARIDSEIEVPLFKNDTEFKENFGNLTQIIFSLLMEIVNPDQLFLPTIDPKKNCGRCPYGYICTN